MSVTATSIPIKRPKPVRVLSDFASGLQAPQPSARSLFLRGDHAQVHLPDPAPGGFLDGRRLAGWCCERAGGVPPDLCVAGVTYWLGNSAGKVRAFYRVERISEQPDGSKRTFWGWRAIAGPDQRLLEMRLASRAGVPVSAIQHWPVFADEVSE